MTCLAAQNHSMHMMLCVKWLLSISKKQNIPLVATFHSKYREDFEHSVYNKYIARQMTNEIIRFYEKADEVWISQPSVEETIREYGYKGKIEVVPLGNDFLNNLSGFLNIFLSLQ